MFGNDADLNNAMAQALRSSMPALKSQAQFNAFALAFDAFRLHVNNLMEGKSTVESREVLDKALDAVKQASEITKKYEEVPEAQGPNSTAFVEAPKEFHEYDEVKRLLFELEHITTVETLEHWYTATTNRRALVKTQQLRNTLLDTIRAKKVALMGS